MNKKRISIFITTILFFSSIPFGIFAINATAKQDPAIPDYQAVDWQSGLGGEVAMPLSKDGLQEFAGAGGMPKAAVSEADVGMQVIDWYLYALWDAYGAGSPYMTLRAVSGNAEVWVADDLNFFIGDPRNNSYNLTITDGMCNHLADEFNDVIYPADTENFGTPLDRDGSAAEGWLGFDWAYSPDTPQRTIIKVLNIVDDNFFDYTYPYFVIGFFSSTYDSPGYYDRNMIHIDAWQWWRRIGDAGDSWLPDHPEAVVPENHAHDYESTIAHEYQHLIHSDFNPGDAIFMNEGCSMFAEQVCGYGISDGYFNSYFATPDNSLTEWGDQGDINILADYGVAALWTVYLSDHYGGAPLIRDFVQAGIPGIDGINAVLATYGYKKDFYDIYHDWRLANLIRLDFPGCRKYNYESIDIASMDPIRMYEVSGLPVPETTGTSFGSTITTLGYDTGVSMLGPFGSDYIEFSNWRKPGRLYFDGDDTALIPLDNNERWTWDGMEWYSGDSDLTNSLIATQIPVGSSTLEVVTQWDIEPFWDFGFIQVSNTGAWDDWVSPEIIGYTTYEHDPGAHPDVIANLPGLTVSSGGDVTLTLDISGYTYVGFRYVTDWNTVEEGWYLRDVFVDGVNIEENLAPVYTPYPEVDYMVTYVQAIETHHHTIYIPFDMRLDDANQGQILGVAKKISFVLVISPMMESGFTDYTFKAARFKYWHWFD